MVVQRARQAGSDTWVGEHKNDSGEIVKTKKFRSEQEALKWEADKRAMPTAGRMKRAALKLKALAKRKTGIDSSATSRREYVAGQNKAAEVKEQGGVLQSVAPELVGAGATAAKAGVTAGGAAAAPLTAGASVPVAMALNKGISKGTKKVQEDLRERNETAKASAYGMLGREEEIEEKMEAERLDEEFHNRFGANYSHEKTRTPGAKGFFRRMLPHAREKLQGSAGEAIDDIGESLEEVDPTGGMIAAAGKKLAKKGAGKAIGMASQAMDDRLGQKYHQLLEGEDEKLPPEPEEASASERIGPILAPARARPARDLVALQPPPPTGKPGRQRSVRGGGSNDDTEALHFFSTDGDERE